jgi:transposase
MTGGAPMSLVYAKNKKNQTIYVYESIGYWDKAKKQGRNTKTCIGKMIDNQFVPNNQYLLREELESIKNTKPGPVPETRFSRTFSGATYLFNAIGEKKGIADDLQICFPDSYKQILSLAYYLIIEDRNPLSRFPKWGKTHKHPFGVSIPSQRSSELFGSISEDAKQQFFTLQAARRGEREYLAYDTTSISSYSKSLKQVKYGRNKDHDQLAQINLALLYGHDSRLPVFYRKLPGNITDVATLTNMLNDIEGLQLEKVKLVMDRGFYSEVNVNSLYAKHYKFLMSAKTSLKFVQKHLDGVRLEMKSRTHYSSSHNLNYYTFMTTWPYTEIKKRTGEILTLEKRIYLHLYYNEQRAVDDKASFNKLLDILEEELCTDKKVPAHEKLYTKYYEIQRTPVRGITLTPKQEAIEDAEKNYGYFTLVSNGISDPLEALSVYRSKDVIEKAFGNLKERLNMRRTSVSSEENLEGKLFVQFIALLYLASIDKTMREFDLYKNSTMSELLDDLDIIERFEKPGHEHYMGEITKKQRKLYEYFGVAVPT